MTAFEGWSQSQTVGILFHYLLDDLKQESLARADEKLVTFSTKSLNVLMRFFWPWKREMFVVKSCYFFRMFPPYTYFT